MIKYSELLDLDRPTSYSCLFIDFAEIAGYYIANNQLTIEHINKVLVDILYEISLYGYTQEEMEIERKKLDESITKYKNTNNDAIETIVYKTIEEMFEDDTKYDDKPRLYRIQNEETEKTKDLDLEKLKKQVVKSQKELFDYTFQKAVKEIKASIQTNN